MIISCFYPTLGGAEQQALLLSEKLSEKGFDVQVLTRHLKNLPGTDKVKGIPVYRQIRVLPWRRIFGPSYLISVLWFLFKKRHSYDIIHCHILYGFHSIAALILQFFSGKKVVVKVAATGPLSDFASLKKVMFGSFFLERLKKLDRIITICSQATIEASNEGFPPSQITRIPNGVNTDFFHPAWKQQVQPGKIIFIGSLNPMKGVHLLIECVARLKEENQQIKLEIIGDGQERSKLEDLTSALGITNMVRFYGEIRDVRKHLQEAELFVLPSFSEGLPNVILEAMATGLPVISTRTGGIPDIIEDGINGLLVEPRNIDQLCEAVNRVLGNRALAQQLALKARETIEARFSIDHTANQYIKLYKELISSH